MSHSRPDPSAPLHLAVLGRVGLERKGEPIRPVLSQPKRTGLLVYAALRRPRGFVSRDELLGVFWPGSTEARARASLRQGLRFLRSHLGEGVLVNRGDAEVGIPGEAMGCDALEVLGALGRGDDREAVAGYGGELLPGFLLTGLHEFERWLHAERQGLRSGVMQASLRLADEAESRGDLDEAAARVRWALDREPTDEAVARRLMSLLSRAGNRGAAVGVYDALVGRLRDELDLEPSPETVELADAVRGGTVPGGAEAGPGRAGGTNPQRVLILGLQDLTGVPNLANVGTLAADVVAQGLAAVSELEVVPPMAAMSGAEAAAEAPSDGGGKAAAPHHMLDLARRTGAGTLVEGTYHLADGRLHLRARITDVAAGRLLEAPEPVVGPGTSPLDAIQEFRDRLVTALAAALTRRSVHVRSAVRPPSLEAHSAYLDGLDRFIRGGWNEALAHFRAASEMEPSFALPRIVSAIAHWNLEELTEARAIAREAGELRGTLGRFEQAVLDMVTAWLDGDWAGAHAAARVQAALAPGSIPHFQVAEEARRLNRPREAREVLSRLDPESGELDGWIFYWTELTSALHLLGDHGRELELAARCRRLHPDDPAAVLLEVRAYAGLGRPDDVVRVIDEALVLPGRRGPSSGELLREGALELQAHGEPDAAKPLLERSVRWYEERVGAPETERVRRERARILYLAGRLDEARALFSRFVEEGEPGPQPVGYHHGQLQAHLDAGYLAVIAVRSGSRDEVERLRRHLEELDAPFLYGAPWFWRACIAALDDDADRAVSLLRRAFAEGLPHELFLHTDPHLLRLRGHAGFDSLMRPRG